MKELNLMNVDITSPKVISSELSLDLNELANTLESDYDTKVIRNLQRPMAGIKDPNIIAALCLTVSGVGILISALAYWQSRKPKYTVTVSRGDVTISIDNITDDAKIRQLTEELSVTKFPNVVEVEVLETLL